MSDLPPGFEEHPPGFVSADAPKVGMGDVQAAPSAQTSTGNVPVGLLTGDAGADQGIARNLREQGQTKDITGRDVGSAAAAAASLLVPELGLGALGTGASAALLSGAQSAARGEDAPGVAWDAIKGGATGYAGHRILGGLFKKVGAYASGKVAAASEKAAAQAAAEQDSAVRSLEAAARERTANAYRQMERIELALRNPALPAEQRAALKAFKATPQYADLVQANARSIAEAAPAALGEREAARQIAEEARTALPDAIKARQAELLSPERTTEQVMARAKRYGPPALGSAVGNAIGGPAGGAVGALAGAGTRPMVHALRRMAQDPAVQTSIWKPLAAAGEPELSAAVIPSGASSLSQHEGDFLRWLLREKAGAPGLRLSGAAADDEGGQ